MENLLRENLTAIEEAEAIEKLRALHDYALSDLSTVLGKSAFGVRDRGECDMSNIKLFESKQIRSVWSDKEQKWLFSVVDVVEVLTDSQNPQVYWRVLKKRLLAEGNETVTNCNGLKMTASDGKMRMTDVANTEQILRLIQSIPSPKAEPFKLWLAQVG